MSSGEDLTLLSGNHSDYPTAPEEAQLETFANSHPNRPYEIVFDCPEFTSICPITGQPDFGSITITYVAKSRCVESKSLKLYLFSFRNHGAFHEEVTNRILDDLVSACDPQWMEVYGDFMPRGGIAIKVKATHGTRSLRSKL